MDSAVIAGCFQSIFFCITPFTPTCDGLLSRYIDHKSPACSSGTSQKTIQTVPVSNNETALPSHPSSPETQWVGAPRLQRHSEGHCCSNMALMLVSKRSPGFSPLQSACARLPQLQPRALEESCRGCKQAWRKRGSHRLALFPKPAAGKMALIPLLTGGERQRRPPLACILSSEPNMAQGLQKSKHCRTETFSPDCPQPSTQSEE